MKLVIPIEQIKLHIIIIIPENPTKKLPIPKLIYKNINE